MAEVSINISLKGIGQVRRLLNRYAQAVGGEGGGNRTELYRRYGIQALNWINKNFQTQGGLLSTGPWAKLSPNTIAGRRKGSSQILQDTGAAGLKGSFTMQFSDQQVVIGSAKEYALYHEKGTGLYGQRGSAYPIIPKTKQALAFPVAQGGKLVSSQLALKATRFGSGRPRKGQTVAIVKSVMHPGVKIRRMLPTEAELMPQLLKTTNNFLNELKGKGEQL